MIILGIETSCDETAASVVKDGRELLSHVVASSAQMHIETGGIIPERAAREQVRSIIPVIEKALLEAIVPVDAIAVTVGPGLIGSLLVGVETARTLAYVWNKPIAPVNHLAAHIYANWLIPEQTTDNKQQNWPEPRLPAVALVVSGGHTDLVLLKDHGDTMWIGGTRDDAAGEAFDKTARILGLPYPGGPAIAEVANKLTSYEVNKLLIKLPRPMMGEENFDFSFSGLKTAVNRETTNLKKENKWNEETVNCMAYEIQEAITDVLVEKTLRAVKEYNVGTLLLAGGVAANQKLREKFEETIKLLSYQAIEFRVPPPWLCTDNASYIASYAYYNFKPVPWQEISANPGLTITQIENLG